MATSRFIVTQNNIQKTSANHNGQLIKKMVKEIESKTVVAQKPAGQCKKKPKIEAIMRAVARNTALERKPLQDRPVNKKEDNTILDKVTDEEATKHQPQNKKSTSHDNKLLPIRRKNSFRKTIICTAQNEYKEDNLNYLKQYEANYNTIKAHYMTKQVHLTWDMRSLLIDWLVSVAAEYKMTTQTLHLSVNYIDRFLSNISVVRQKLQLIGATAMLIASKMEEVYPPEPNEWSYLTGDAFSVRQIVKMEQFMLKVLEFKLNAPTIMDFIQHFCVKHKINDTTMYLAMYLSELTLLEGKDYLAHLPSKLAAASIFLARHTLFTSNPWTETIEQTTGYTLKHLSPVVEKQQKTFKSSPFKVHQSIQKKYSSDKYHRVSLLKPRILKLDDADDN